MNPSPEFVQFYRWWPKHLKIHGIQLKHCANKHLCTVYSHIGDYTHMVIYPFEFAIGISEENISIFPRLGKNRDIYSFTVGGTMFDNKPLLCWPRPELTLNEYKGLFRTMIKQAKVNEL